MVYLLQGTNKNPSNIWESAGMEGAHKKKAIMSVENSVSPENRRGCEVVAKTGEVSRNIEFTKMCCNLNVTSQSR